MKARVNQRFPDVMTVLTDHLTTNPDDDVCMIVNEDNVVKLIYVQTWHMKEVFNKFPEVLLVHGTYSINNSGMPLYSFLAEDGHGQWQIVGMMLLAGEDSNQIKCMIDIFSESNPAMSCTHTVITDKDFTEIAAIEAVLLHAKLQQCTFHCIKAEQKKLVHCLSQLMTKCI